MTKNKKHEPLIRAHKPRRGQYGYLAYNPA